MRTVEEILKAKAEWEERERINREQYDKECVNYRKAEQKVFDIIESKVVEKLPYDLGLKVCVTEGYRADNICRVCVEPKRTLGFRWSWCVEITKNGFELSTNSWSNAELTTDQALEELRQTYETLMVLNHLDWNDIANVEMPKYKDYIKTQSYLVDENGRYMEKPNFDNEIKEVVFAECIGKPMIIQLDNGYTKRYISICKETPKFYEIVEHNCSIVEDLINGIRRVAGYDFVKHTTVEVNTLKEYYDFEQSHSNSFRKKKIDLYAYKDIKIVYDGTKEN